MSKLLKVNSNILRSNAQTDTPLGYFFVNIARIKLLFKGLNDMQNEDEFQAEKAQLIAEREAAEKRYAEAQTRTQELTLDTQLWGAYLESGGIGNDNDHEAYEAIKRHLKDGGRISFENGQPVFVGEDGQPKSAAEIVAELKQHPTYKQFFSGDVASNQTDQPTEQKIYSRDDARTGKASMKDIASGKATVENSSGKPDWVPDTKRVNASEVAKTKDRRWK